MKKSISLILKRPLTGVFLLILLVSALSSPFIELNKLKFQDDYSKARLFYYERFRKDFPKESAVVIVDIDEESVLKTKAEILVNDEALAKAVESISKYKPKVIVFDIAIHSRSYDALAEAIKDAGNVLIPYDPKDFGVEYIGESIMDASAGYGPTNFAMFSKDYVVRRFTYVLGEKDKQMIPLPAIAALMYKGLPVKKLEARRHKKKVVLTSSKKIVMTLPFDTGFYPLMDYLYNDKNTAIIPMWKVLEGDISTEALKGKIVLIAAISGMRGDRKLTSIGRMPGSMIFLNLINMFVHDEFLLEIPPMAELIILFLLGTILCLLLLRASLLKGLAILLFAILASLATSFILYVHNVFWSAFEIIALSLFIYIAIVFYKARTWEIERSAT